MAELSEDEISEDDVLAEEVELIIDAPIFEILGDLYVCSECGTRLTEIPAYNRYYCENCGLHY
jgi:predicted amidophosphoribosyltransferase